MDDTRALAADGTVHLVPPHGTFTFCGREPLHAVTAGEPCEVCVELAAARDAAAARTPR